MDKFVSVKPLDAQIDSEQAVLKAGDYKRLVSYEQLLKMLERKELARDQEVTAAKAGALREGFRQGKEKASEQLSSELLKYNESMDEALVKLEQDLIDVVTQAVRKVVADFDDEVLVKNALKGGMELVRGSKKLVVRVNPQLYDMVSAQLQDMQETTRHVEVVGDGHLKSTDCILESDIGIVNASVDQQLELITKSLKNAFQKQAHIS